MYDQPRNSLKWLVFWAFLLSWLPASDRSFRYYFSDGPPSQCLSRTGDSVSQGIIKSFDSLSQKFKEAETKKDTVAQQISDILDRRGTMEDFLRILKQQDGEVTAFSEKLWCGLLDYATAYTDGRLTFTFKNGSTFEG